MGKFSYYKGDGMFWFRIFNMGLCIKDTLKHPMLFSERHGYVRYIKIGKWLIKSVQSNG